MYFSTVIQGMQLEPVLVLSFQFWVLRKGFLCPSFLNFFPKIVLVWGSKNLFMLVSIENFETEKGCKNYS